MCVQQPSLSIVSGWWAQSIIHRGSVCKSHWRVICGTRGSMKTLPWQNFVEISLTFGNVLRLGSATFGNKRLHDATVGNLHWALYVHTGFDDFDPVLIRP